MKPSHRLSLITSAMLCLASPCIASAAGPLVGVGESGLADARVAGAEAAGKARRALGDSPPKLVLVFAARKQVTPQLVEGIGQVFEKTLVYGCEGYAPISPEGNFAELGHNIPAGVAVMAIGGDVDFTAASAVVANPTDSADRPRVFRENGKSVAAALKAAWDAAQGGKLILTFGNQHFGDNQPYVDGVAEVLGHGFQMVGAAAGKDAASEIVRGEIIKGANVAILMTGKFKTKTMSALDSVKDLPGDAAFKAVLGNEKASCIFAFDSGGRRNKMIQAGTLLKDWQAMKANAGTVPFIGFYGGGEVGNTSPGGPCVGITLYCSAAAVIPQQP